MIMIDPTLLEKIKKKVSDIHNTAYDITPINYIPTIDDSKLPNNNKGLRFNAVVLYIDMRKSSELIEEYYKTTVCKFHSAYYYVLVECAGSFNGEIRSFNGDSLLVFFHGDDRYNRAVKCAFSMVEGLTQMNGIFSKHRNIDYGIGITEGDITVTKVGSRGDETKKDLIWVGDAVNKAVRISDACKEPNWIGVSESVFGKISDDLKWKKMPSCAHIYWALNANFRGRYLFDSPIYKKIEGIKYVPFQRKIALLRKKT